MNTLRWAALALTAISLAVVGGATLTFADTENGQTTPRGLWPLPRRDAQNTARADVPGEFRQAPREVWSFGSTQQSFDFLRPVMVGGREAYYFAKVRGTLEVVRSDGSRLWQLPNFGAIDIIEVFDFGKAGAAALVMTGNNGLALVDAATGKVPWRWSPPPKANLGGPKVWKRGDRWRLALFPQNTIEGQCWEFAAPDTAPTLLWRQEYPGKYWANFGPYPVIADMDNDGRDDIVLTGKPTYVAVIDPDTGKIQFDLQYPLPGVEGIGRPYGLIQAVDMDGDGFRDVIVASCQVEEYIGVLRNEGGKAFKLAWSRFVEKDLPDDDLELRPQVASVADVDGDGKREIVLGLFNTEGDKRWRTVVLDAFRGWDARKVELPDRYFWGSYDLNGDGRAEIITSTEKARRFAALTTLQAVDGRTGKDIAVVEKAGFSIGNAPLPPDREFHAGRNTPTHAELPAGAGGLVVRREGQPGESLWSLEGGASRFTPFALSTVSRLVFLGGQGTKIARTDGAIREPETTPEPAVTGPLVAMAGGKRELIAARADGFVVGGVPDWKHPGRFTSSWTVRGVTPSVWMGPDGRRLVAAFDLTADRLHIYDPKPGQQDAPPLVSIELPYAPFRSPGLILPFGDTEARFYVGMKTGVHTCAGAVYDAKGRQVWLDEKEGPYPRPAGVVDDRGVLIVDNHGKHLLYEPDGSKRVIAQGWYDTIPGRGDGAKYVLPIIGPFGPEGAKRIVMSPGLENLEILDASGARVARSLYGAIYEREFSGSAVARLRPGGAPWDIGMLTKAGMFHCADLGTGKDRWTFDTEVPAAHPSRIASGDVDGDGRDNFVTGLSNGHLIALDEREGRGVVLWRVVVDAAIRDVLIADLNGDAKAEIVVETDDGRVRVFGKGIGAGE